MASTLPDLPPFDPDTDPASTPQRWTQYLRRLNTALEAWDIKDDKRKCAVLLHRGGEKIHTIEEHLTYTKTEGDTFKNLCTALTQHFQPTGNVTFCTYEFCNMRQEEGENIDAFIIRLRTQAALCDFNDTDRRIKDQIVFNCYSKKVCRKALTDDLSLDDLIKVARAEEKAVCQAGEIEKHSNQGDQSESETFRISRQPGKYSSRPKHPPTTGLQASPVTSKAAPDEFRPRTNKYQYRSRQNYKCYHCGGFPLHPRHLCPAFGKICSNCQKNGHFASCCRSDKKIVRQIDSEQLPEYDQSQTEQEYTFTYHVIAINNIENDNKIHHKNNTNVAPIYVNGQRTDFCLDSGSLADMTAVEFRKLRPIPPLQPSSHSLWPFDAIKPLKTVGFFRGKVQATPDGPSLMTDIHVVETRGRACCLLSKSTSKALGLLTINLPKEIKQISSLPNVDSLVTEYDDICHGIGCHKDVVVSLPMDPEVKPVACPPSRVPIHLLPAIKSELDRLMKEGVIENVPIDDNNQWIS